MTSGLLGAYRCPTAGAEPGNGRPADSAIRHTANPLITLGHTLRLRQALA
ncbi:hypothetical protein [Streptomyces sp. NPDC004008]